MLNEQGRKFFQDRIIHLAKSIGCNIVTPEEVKQYEIEFSKCREQTISFDNDQAYIPVYPKPPTAPLEIFLNHDGTVHLTERYNEPASDTQRTAEEINKFCSTLKIDPGDINAETREYKRSTSRSISMPDTESTITPYIETRFELELHIDQLIQHLPTQTGKGQRRSPMDHATRENGTNEQAK